MCQPIAYANLERNARHHGRHCPAPRSFLWHECSVLGKSTESLRPAARPGEGRKIHQSASHSKTASSYTHEGIQLYPCAALLAFWHRADDGLIFSGGRSEGSVGRREHGRFPHNFWPVYRCQDAQIFTQQPRTAKVGLAKAGSCSLCSLIEIAGGQTCHTLA